MDRDRTELRQRFICDEMLIRLGRWLRAAGYHTELAERGGVDKDLMARARAGQMTILTRDRKLLEHRDARVYVTLVVSGKLSEQAQEITRALGIDWQKQPFSRCLVDNAPVRPATEDEIAALPWSGRGVSGPYTICPDCGRSYWTGGHTQRMLGVLEHWSQGRFGEAGAKGK